MRTAIVDSSNNLDILKPLLIKPKSFKSEIEFSSHVLLDTDIIDCIIIGDVKDKKKIIETAKMLTNYRGIMYCYSTDFNFATQLQSYLPKLRYLTFLQMCTELENIKIKNNNKRKELSL